MAERGSPVVYRVNADDILVYVNAGWSVFARENGAPHLTPESVLGRTLWDFVDGEGIVTLYKAILGSLRESRGEVLVPFRCDSPGTVRHMELCIRSGVGGGIEFEGRLLFARPRGAQDRRPVARAMKGNPILFCRSCRRVRLRGRWVTALEGVVQGRLMNLPDEPDLRATTCEPCSSPSGGSD